MAVGRLGLEVLGLVVRLAPEAYGLRIHEMLERQRRKRIGMTSVYKALVRLEGDGYVVSVKEQQTRPTTGGVPRRLYAITTKGLAELEQMKRILAQTGGSNGGRKAIGGNAEHTG